MQRKTDGRISAGTVDDALLNLRQVTFEVTDDCNLRCRYCGYGDFYFGYDRRESRYMPFAMARAMLDYLAAVWRAGNADSPVPRTSLGFYGGEPLMNVPLIKRIIEYADSLALKRRFVYTMTTNAMLLDKHMDYIAEKGFNLLVSLDGDRRGSSYRVTRAGGSSFDRVLHNVRLLRDSYPDYFREKVNFNAVLHNRNSVSSIMEFIRGEFGKEPMIAELNTVGIRSEKREEFRAAYKNLYESVLDAEDSEALEREMFINSPMTYELMMWLHRYSGNVYRKYSELLVDTEGLSIVPTATCLPFAKKLFLTVNGKILPCERIHQTFCFGSVTPEGRVELDTGKAAEIYNSYLERVAAQCSGCARGAGCIQCIYNIPEMDNPGCRHPACEAFAGERRMRAEERRCRDYLLAHPDLYERIMKEVKLT